MEKIKNFIPKGTLFKMNCGAFIEVVEYTNAAKILVKFTDNKSEPFYAHISNLQKGKYKNRFHPCSWGVGYEGIGKYSFSADSFAARSWRGIIQRAYSVTERNSRPLTKDVVVCEEWHNFQNFAEWAVSQKGYGLENFEIDKDLIVLGNSMYSKEYCCYLPREINTRLPKRYGDFDKVYYYEKEGVYKSFYNDETKVKRCISGKDREQVSMLRKIAINKMIKCISEKYFEYLDEKVIARLCDYYELDK